MMSNDSPINYDEIRARALKRVEPQIRVRKLRLFFWLNLIAFITVMSLGFSGPNGPFYEFTQESAIYNGVSQTFTTQHPYPLALAFSVAWLLLLVGHFLWVQMVAARERLIQREMDREVELERKRLDLELLRLQTESDGAVPEKVKRAIRLSDDGELLTDEAPLRSARQRSS